MDAAAASRLRQKLHTLCAERHRIEEALLETRALLSGPLIAHSTLAGGKRRSTPAFYLYRKEEGRKRVLYVRQADLEKTRRLVAAHRQYRDRLRRLRLLGAEILTAFKALSDSLEEPLR